MLLNERSFEKRLEHEIRVSGCFRIDRTATFQNFSPYHVVGGPIDRFDSEQAVTGITKYRE